MEQVFYLLHILALSQNEWMIFCICIRALALQNWAALSSEAELIRKRLNSYGIQIATPEKIREVREALESGQRYAVRQRWFVRIPLSHAGGNPLVNVLFCLSGLPPARE